MNRERRSVLTLSHLSLASERVKGFASEVLISEIYGKRSLSLNSLGHAHNQVAGGIFDFC